MLYMVALSLIEGVGLSAKHKLLEEFGTPESIFGNTDLEKVENYCMKSAELIINRCKKENTEIICFGNGNYPKMLRGINNAPLVLYCRGNTKIMSKRSVAVVGSRYANENGKKDAYEISVGLAEAGFVIVSGLAKGIDTVVHTAALSIKKETIAVMATGINEITPAENIGLAKRIISEGGVVITEQIPDKLSFAPNFVQRNRIISGLSLCSIIVSAPEKSGALHTARFAEHQGRKVLVAPGNRSDELYAGGNKLLMKSNIFPALSVEDMVSVINGVKKTDSIKQIGIFDVAPATPEVSNAYPVIKYLSNTPISLENLSAVSGIATDSLYELLLDLTFDGVIKQDIAGNYYLS